MPVTPFQEKALNLLLADPAASKEMQRHLSRIDPSLKPQLPDVQMEERVMEAVRPLEEKIDKLTAQLAEKKTVDFHEQEADKLRKLGWKKEQIEELRERMKADPDNNLYGSYLAAARYYQGMDQPLMPSGHSNRTMTGRVKEQGAEPWREQVQDPKSALRGNRREARSHASKEWDKAKAEFRNR
jgi:hypothetical protein